MRSSHAPSEAYFSWWHFFLFALFHFLHTHFFITAYHRNCKTKSLYHTTSMYHAMRVHAPLLINLVGPDLQHSTWAPLRFLDIMDGGVSASARTYCIHVSSRTHLNCIYFSCRLISSVSLRSGEMNQKPLYWNLCITVTQERKTNKCW